MRIKIIGILLLFSSIAIAQRDTSFFKKLTRDTSVNKMNMDAIYERPFLQMGLLPVAIGGYLEANTTHSSTDGASEGFSFQIPRMTIFLFILVANNRNSYVSGNPLVHTLLLQRT